MNIDENHEKRERALFARWTVDGALQTWRKAHDPSLRANLYVADYTACRPSDLARDISSPTFRSVIGQVEQVVLVGDSGGDPESEILDKTLPTLLLRVPASFTYSVEGTKGLPGDERAFRELGLIAARTFLPMEFGRREVSYGRDHFVFAADRSAIRSRVLTQVLGPFRDGAPVSAHGPSAWDLGFLRTWLQGADSVVVSDSALYLQQTLQGCLATSAERVVSISTRPGEPAGRWCLFLATEVPGAAILPAFESAAEECPAEAVERARYWLDRKREEADRAEELEWEIEARAFRLAKQLVAKGGAE